MLGLFGLAVVGAVVWSRSRPATAPQTDATPTMSPLWTTTPADIQSLKLEDMETGQVVEAHRDPQSGWALDQPTGLADSGRLEMAADSLLAPMPSDSLSSANLKDFGLASPHQRVTLTLKDGSTKVLEIGSTAPTGSVVYVKDPALGNTVYFLDSYGLSDVTGLLDNPPIATPTPVPSPTSSSVTTPLPTLVLPVTPDATNTP